LFLEYAMSSAAPLPRIDDSVLLRADASGIATLTLSRPLQFNALSSALLNELQTALDSIEGDESVRVVVIAGAGPAFCAGHDLKEMMANHAERAHQELFSQCSRMMLTLTRIPQPVIAKVHGIATAAGCQLVAQCDLAIAASNARFATSGVNLGLFCTTPGVALARNVSRKRAMEMLLTGDFIDAETALGFGLVNRVVAPEQLDLEVQALAENIAAKPRVAVASGKKMFYRQLETGLSEAYQLASHEMACNMMAGDTVEGVKAFIEKRPPNWRKQ
jgi:enoyl-CoA hydratase/carnithine racemase